MLDVNKYHSHYNSYVGMILLRRFLRRGFRSIMTASTKLFQPLKHLKTCLMCNPFATYEHLIHKLFVKRLCFKRFGLVHVCVGSKMFDKTAILEKLLSLAERGDHVGQEIK